ncbi:unnamed protein product [Rotaria socialis]|uniref:Replication-associated protein n=1 Tax=Rotaria socialis TaxID=392032 RepID=A0A817Y2W9_9BILA|nr:unnamed protein product [Rotaria socialis]
MASNTTDHTQSIMGADSSSDSDSDFLLDLDYVSTSTPKGFNTSNDASYSSSVTTTTITSEISRPSRPYPPTERHGLVDEHDKPFLEFGELGAKAIASLKEFRLPAEYIPFCESDPTIRASRKNNRLGRNLQARTSVSRGEENTCPLLVFHGKPAVNAQFMDRFLNCQCEYHVTKHANAWNEYMKQGFSCIEHGLYKGSDKKGFNLWPNSPTTKKGACLTDDIAAEAFKLSKKSVPVALKMLVEKVPRESLTRLRGKPPPRPQCLILIGKTGTRKTSFALSLPGIPNYYRGVWSIVYWDNDASCMIFDDIPWRSFDKKGYPSKKDLLTGQLEVCVSDKYCKNRKIVVNKPAIVFLNHADTQPLLNPRTKGERDDFEFWQERAIICVLVYHLEPNEHFYNPKPKTPSPENKIHTVGGIPLFDEFRRVWRERQQQQTVPPAPAPPPSTSIIVQPQTENQLRRQSVSSEEYPYEL